MMLLAMITSITLIIAQFLSLTPKQRLENSRLKKPNGILGAVASTVALLVALWLSAPLMLRVPSESFRELTKQSAIITAVRSAFPMAPSFIATLGDFLNDSTFPQVFTGQEPKIDTSKPLPDLGSFNTAVKKARASTVKIESLGCGGVVDGTGFVVGEGIVATNAHVIAGIRHPTIVDANGRHRGEPVWFDPNIDLALIRANDLAGQPLPIRESLVNKGTPAVILGYPGGGDFTATPSLIAESFTAKGRNIYNKNAVSRSVYSMHAEVHDGNSGGPVINEQGEVVGVIFASSTEYASTSYALTADYVVNALEQAAGQTATTTGQCMYQ